MSYQVLARKYRPNILSELVGQEVLVQTLLSSIKQDKIAHAFILSGIRGIGKTTTARIIAKALNCIGEDGTLKNASNPCGKCATCLSIANSTFPDVIEMDAASKTGVDDIREIIDNISYATSIGRYKVYIIDEVHMLSNNAFNALLKTLEEPPAHVKFIFATTEIKKIPITIISRCQRFDLKRITTEKISSHLKEILEKESFEAQERVLNLIANLSEGSMRDALSLLDQALSYNNYEKLLTSDIFEEMIGLVDKNSIIDFIENLLKGDVENVIKIFNDFYDKSIDITSLAAELLSIIHDITLLKTIKNYQLSNIAQISLDKMNEIANNISIAELARIWQMLAKGIDELKKSQNHKMSFEMILVRICYMSNIANFEQLIVDNNKKNTQNSNNESILAGEVLRNFPKSEIIT
ncbi:DNA polymerase III subunit gamma/tau [Rickettsiales bacterium]|nr:DNA polymerase III subunit gamma/tau [Rickettsiales bacterium]